MVHESRISLKSNMEPNSDNEERNQNKTARQKVSTLKEISSFLQWASPLQPNKIRSIFSNLFFFFLNGSSLTLCELCYLQTCQFFIKGSSISPPSYPHPIYIWVGFVSYTFLLNHVNPCSFVTPYHIFPHYVIGMFVSQIIAGGRGIPKDLGQPKSLILRISWSDPIGSANPHKWGFAYCYRIQ